MLTAGVSWSAVLVLKLIPVKNCDCLSVSCGMCEFGTWSVIRIGVKRHCLSVSLVCEFGTWSAIELV